MRVELRGFVLLVLGLLLVLLVADVVEVRADSSEESGERGGRRGTPNKNPGLPSQGMYNRITPQKPAYQNVYPPPRESHKPNRPGGPSCPNKPTFTCNCVSSDKKSKKRCEWKRVFKAVMGSTRNVREDFLTGGDINSDDAEAITLASTKTFRDPKILDKWEELHIDMVRVEVFDKGDRKTFFIFNGAGTDITNWFSPNRLMSSPYVDLDNIQVDGVNSFFSLNGNIQFKRSFLIQRVNNQGCGNDCVYLAVKESQATDPCNWDSASSMRPFFMYSTEPGCGKFDRPGERDIGDRFVISVKVCDW